MMVPHQVLDVMHLLVDMPFQIRTGRWDGMVRLAFVKDVCRRVDFVGNVMPVVLDQTFDRFLCPRTDRRPQHGPRDSSRHLRDDDPHELVAGLVQSSEHCDCLLLVSVVLLLWLW